MEMIHKEFEYFHEIKCTLLMCVLIAVDETCDTSMCKVFNDIFKTFECNFVTAHRDYVCHIHMNTAFTRHKDTFFCLDCTKYEERAKKTN